MSDNSDPRRDGLHEYLQEMGPPMGGPAVLTGWAVVLEWMDDEGDRWLSRGYASSKAKWEADGMLHEALYGQWPAKEDGE